MYNSQVKTKRKWKKWLFASFICFFFFHRWNRFWRNCHVKNGLFGVNRKSFETRRFSQKSTLATQISLFTSNIDSKQRQLNLSTNDLYIVHMHCELCIYIVSSCLTVPIYCLYALSCLDTDTFPTITLIVYWSILHRLQYTIQLSCVVCVNSNLIVNKLKRKGFIFIYLFSFECEAAGHECIFDEIST